MSKVKCKIADLGRIAGGGTPDTGNLEYYNGNISWITPKDLVTNKSRFISKGERMITKLGLDNSSAKLIPKNSILFSSRAPIGYIAIAKNELSTNQGFRSIIPNVKIDYLFLYYLLVYNKDYIASFGAGTTFKEISGSVLGNIDVYLPKSIDIQKKISCCLDLLDRKIELNNQINDNLEKQMKLLYDYWFVQFEFPDENGKPYKSSGGSISLKSDTPENFETISLSNIVSFLSGYPFSSNDYDDTGKYKLITIKNVQDTGINLEVDNRIKTIPEKMQDYCKLKPHDILMSLTGNVGRIGLMYCDNCLLNQRVAVDKPIFNNINPYIYCLLKSSVIRSKFENISNGSSQSNLSPVEAGKIVISYNNELALKFSKTMKSTMDEIIKNLSENQKLINLRDFLLPLLMNGQATIE